MSLDDVLRSLRALSEAGDEALRDLERRAQQGDAAAQERLTWEAARREPLQIVTSVLAEPAQPSSVTRPRDFTTLVSSARVSTGEIAKAVWNYYPHAWPSPQTNIVDIFVRQGFERLKNWEDVFMREVGHKYPAATQFPFRGRLQPL